MDVVSPPHNNVQHPDSRVQFVSGPMPVVALDSALSGRQQLPQPARPLSVSEISPLAEILARQFMQRWDMYPQQLSDGRWLTVHEPLQVSLLVDHLRGRCTLGTYLLDTNSQGRFLVLDADDLESWQWLLCLSKSLYLCGVTSYLEASRRGGHLWLFLPGKFDGLVIRQFGWGLLDRFGIDKGAVEFFPKQSILKHGPGSQIRLPFGMHRKSHKRYGFQDPTGRLLAPTLRQQLTILGQPETVDKRVFDHFRQHGETLARKKQRRLSSQPPKPLEKQSELAQLAVEIKSSIRVREFVGRYVELSPSGRGLCPFHDDHQPSLNVNDEQNYWYCFACEKGGSLIDFWMLWRGCDFRQAVTELKFMFFA